MNLPRHNRYVLALLLGQRSPDSPLFCVDAHVLSIIIKASNALYDGNVADLRARPFWTACSDFQRGLMERAWTLSPAFAIVFYAPRRVGKTHALSKLAVALAETRPHVQVVVVTAGGRMADDFTSRLSPSALAAPVRVASCLEDALAYTVLPGVYAILVDELSHFSPHVAQLFERARALPGSFVVAVTSPRPYNMWVPRGPRITDAAIIAWPNLPDDTVVFDVIAPARSTARDDDWHLTSMYLSKNRLSGTLPDSIVALTGVRVIDLAHNDLGGRRPRAIGGSAGLPRVHLAGTHVKVDTDDPWGRPLRNLVETGWDAAIMP